MNTANEGRLRFPGVTMTLTEEALILHSERALHVLSSAVVGGGFGEVSYIVNRHVHGGYDHPEPENDLRAFAHAVGIAEPFVGMMTAARLDTLRAVTLESGGLMVACLNTMGLSNPTSAGLSEPARCARGTINTILLIDGNLSDAAMVNAVITATEAKAAVLMSRRVRTPVGYLATGTSTDAIVVACTGEGERIRYAGPATEVGWLIGRCVRKAMSGAVGRSTGLATG
jgi:iron complex transport system ATP-binding protein